MLVYIAATTLSVITSMLVLKYKKDNKIQNNAMVSILMILSAFPLIFISAIRYDVGQDYMYTYVPYFNGLLIGNVNSNVEIGFYLLNKIIQIFTDDFIWIFVISSIIFFYFMFRGIFEQSPNPPLSIFLLVGTSYCFIFLNTMRQMMSVAIILYALKYVKSREFKKFLIYVLIASTFHSSSIIMLVIYFIYNIKVEPKIGLSIVAIVFVLKNAILKLLHYIIMSTKYSTYIGVAIDNGASGGFITFAIDLVILLFAWYYYKEQNDTLNKKDYYFHCNLQLIAVLINIIKDVAPLINRLRWDFGCMCILLIPISLAYEKSKKNRHVIQLMLIAIFTIYILYTIGLKNGNNVLPYKTIFEL